MKKDELNNLDITNSDGHFNVEEDSLKTIKEIEKVDETLKSEKEVFKASEEYKAEEENKEESFDNPSESSSSDNSSGGSESSSSSAGASSASASAAGGVGAAIGAIGGVVGVVAISAVMVLNIVNLPLIPAVDVHLIKATNSSLAFELSTNIEDQSNLMISLKGEEYEATLSFQEYVKFAELSSNQEYTLSVFEDEKTRYTSKYYTNEEEEINNISITVTSYIDDKLLFYFEDSNPAEKLYTVNVKDKKGTIIFTDETNSPREYEIDNFLDDVAIFVAVNGTISAGVQVFKPIYDYNNINWIWGDYGETVTAIIPSLNGTNDYYVRDIRNFEIEAQEPTCLVDGFSVRQAAFIGPDKNRYESQKRFIIPAKGHDFSDLTYTWGSDYLTCHAEASCSECDVIIDEEVTCSVEEVVLDSGVSFTKYSAVFENENFSTRYHYEDLLYGSYPQSKVLDNLVIEDLNNENGTPLSMPDKWTAYNYYANSSLEEYMYYVDVDNNEDGLNDYRGVYFSSYRPFNTSDALGSSSYQYDNGYLTNTVYWFNYDPIDWVVLESNGTDLFITSKLALDSQSFYHMNSENAFDHNDGFGYANNYELSDIRKWLNEEFYNALPSSKIDVINTSAVDNSLASTLDNQNEYVSNDTNDKLFLLSRSEVKEYLSNSQTSIEGSDYAKCQGLYAHLETSKAFYGLRTPYPNDKNTVRYITNTGSVNYDAITKTSLGVRPSCHITIE